MVEILSSNTEVLWTVWVMFLCREFTEEKVESNEYVQLIYVLIILEAR